MIELIPLCEMVVDVLPALNVGVGAAGSRSVGAISAATVTGERLTATLVGPAAGDWMVRTGSIGVIDVRLTLRTHDDALIYMTYGGRLILSDPAAIVALVAPVFETGDERYAWLNGIQAVGKGSLSLSAAGAKVIYEISEIR